MPAVPESTKPLTTALEPTESPVVDPFMAEMLKSIGKVVTPDGKYEPEPVDQIKVEPANPDLKPKGLTLGEELALNERLRKEAEEAAKNGNDDPGPAPAPIPAPAPAAAPAPPASKLRKITPVVAPVAPLPAPTPLPTPTPPPAPTPAPVADPDAAFIATLDADQQAELDMAAFAEKKFPELVGKRAETLAYFKKVEEFGKAHTEATPEEVNQFISANKPAWKPGQKRKVEHTFIAEQAAATATEAVRKEMQPQITEANKKIKQQELAPVIDKAVGEFRDLISSAETLPDKATMEAIPAEVGKRIAEVGYEKAAEEFHLEAPIFKSTDDAGREWLRLSNGVVDFNSANDLHKWLLDFVTNQGRIYAANPVSVLPSGKRFMPLLEHLELSRNKPEEASHFYTFNDKDVLHLLAVNANIAYNRKLEALEKSGFKREKKKPSVIPQNNPPTPTPTPPPVPTPTPSPRMKPSGMPGPGDTTKKLSDNASFLDKLVPGASERLGVV